MADLSPAAHLMVRVGREEDIEGVISVLKRMWDVDVNFVLREDVSFFLFEYNLSSVSPLYFNKELLFAIAHILLYQRPALCCSSSERRVLEEIRIRNRSA